MAAICASIIFENIRNAFVYVLLIGVLCLSVFSKEFFQIMTAEKFHEAYWYVPMIIVGVYSSSLSMLYGTIITARGKTKINSLISIVGASISITLNVLFLPKFGLITAAIVSSLAMTVMLLIFMWYSKIKLSHSRPVFSVIFVAATIYLLVYVIDIKQLLFSIAIKSILLVIVIIGISMILSINPIKQLKAFTIKG